jgi:hypothetical protein
MSKIKLIFFPSLLADLPTFRMSSYFTMTSVVAELPIFGNQKPMLDYLLGETIRVTHHHSKSR